MRSSLDQRRQSYEEEKNRSVPFRDFQKLRTENTAEWARREHPKCIKPKAIAAGRFSFEPHQRGRNDGMEEGRDRLVSPSFWEHIHFSETIGLDAVFGHIYAPFCLHFRAHVRHAAVKLISPLWRSCGRPSASSIRRGTE
jgi:hypothetical protein